VSDRYRFVRKLAFSSFKMSKIPSRQDEIEKFLEILLDTGNKE